MSILKLVVFFIFISFQFNCFAKRTYIPNDPLSTPETKNLFNNLFYFAKEGIIFSHQNAFMEGISWEIEGVSDVYAVSGKNVGVAGFEFRKIEQNPLKFWQSTLTKMRYAYDIGSAVTLTWHMFNPITGGNYDDLTPALHRIINGGDFHEKFKEKLDFFAQFLKSAKGSDGKSIPIIFRPWHEHNGTWFWWNARQNEIHYKELFRFTVNYLKVHHNLHNLLIAYSPDKFYSKEEYYYGYPGDEYVDILGLDFYTSDLNDCLWQLEFIASEGLKKGKVSALTETGVEQIKYYNYWSKRFLKPLKSRRALKSLSYVMFWRNAFDAKNHFYVPYPGHWSVFDFNQMAKDSHSIFLENYPHSIYQNAKN